MGILEAALLFFVALWRERNYDMHNFEMKQEIRRLVRIIKVLEKKDGKDYLIDDWDDRKKWFANDGIDCIPGRLTTASPTHRLTIIVPRETYSDTFPIIVSDNNCCILSLFDLYFTTENSLYPF